MPMPGGVDPRPPKAKEQYDCQSCPSFLSREQAKKAFNRDFGVPICGARGLVLGNAAWSTRRARTTRVAIGSGCELKGKPLPRPLPAELVLQVAYPHPEAERAGRQPDSATITSCQNCTWYVPATVVSGRHGWTMPLCAAQGRLMDDSRLPQYAKDCNLQFGYGTRAVGGGSVMVDIEMLPAWDADFDPDAGTKGTPIDVWIAGKSGYDPERYETDAEVTPDDIENGVRAWRVVHDPEGFGPDVYHPIFDASIFPEEDRDKIPLAGSDEHPELYVDTEGLVYTLFVTWMEEDDTPNLIGEAGTGKTELMRHVAYLMGAPFDRINIDGSTDKDDIVGKWTLDAERTMVWLNGRLSHRWGLMGVTCIDEWNCGPDEVEQCLRPLTDDSKQLVLDAARGQRITRHPMNFLGLTQNPNSPLYIGANPVSEAGGSRVTSIEVNLPPEAVERDILRNRCQVEGYDLPDEKLDVIMAIAKELRSKVADGLPISWGIRPQIKVARKTKFYRWEKAYNLVVGNRVEPGVRDQIIDVVRKYTTDEMGGL